MPTTTKTKNEQISLSSSHKTLTEKLSDKHSARDRLLQKLGIAKSNRQPIVGLVTAGADAKLVSELQEACGQLKLHLVNVDSLKGFDWLALDIAVFATTNLAHGHDALAAVKNGAIPVVYEQIAPKHTVADYDPLEESGNSFFFAKTNVWSIFAAIVRAVETYRFPYDWSGIVRNAIQDCPTEQKD